MIINLRLIKFATFLLIFGITVSASLGQAAFESELSQATPGAEPTAAAVADEESAEADEPTDEEPDVKDRVASGEVAVLDLSVLKDFEKQPPAVRKLLEEAAELTRMGLPYKYGGSSPDEGAMDCSGTIYYLLQQAEGVKGVPRSSLGQYQWVWEKEIFQAVSGHTWNTFEMDELRPGDLLFWVGTYSTQRDPAVSHVMIYAGFDEKREQHVMVGASEGRRYDGKARYGVSAFDFAGPEPRREKGFIGYAPVPGLVKGRG